MKQNGIAGFVAGIFCCSLHYASPALAQNAIDRVTGFARGDATGRVVYQPDNALADAKGYVRMPDIDMGSQMSQLIMAQRGFQAQSAVIKNAQDVYSSALSIGKA